MKKSLAYAGGALLLLPLLLTAINIAQNGTSTPDGRDAETILGVEQGEATVEHVRRLSKADLMQLFYALDAPEPGELDGEYDAVLIDVGVLSAGSAWYTHHIFGDGRWLGKGFRAARNGRASPSKAQNSVTATTKADTYGDTRGDGYNLFAGSGAGGARGGSEVQRLRKFDTYPGPSRIAAGDSFHLDYHAYNGGTVHSMRDEIRKINNNLYLGMGHMALGGGAINPAPFMLLGPAKGPARESVDGPE
ncbi:MAG: hypothetical protein RIF32_22940 [Leptospirales bacterium]